MDNNVVQKIDVLEQSQSSKYKQTHQNAGQPERTTS